MNPNALRQWLDVHREYFGAPSGGTYDHSLNNYGYASRNARDAQSGAMLWAQDMAQRQGGQQNNMPDFFGGDQPQGNVLRDYVRPEQSQMQMPPRGSYDEVPPLYTRRDTPMRGRATNMLANLMGRR